MRVKAIGHTSIKTRITLFTLAIFLVAIWSLEFYAARELHTDMLHQLGQQMFATASSVAASVDRELQDRFMVLEKVSGRITPTLLGDPSKLQAYLEERLIIRGQFNAGVVAFGADGTAIAELPLTTGRVGVNYRDIDCVAAALDQGKASVGRPLTGKKIPAPLLTMAVPVRTPGGAVIGALAGVIDLSRDNVLDTFTRSGSATSAGYLLLVDVRNRRIVSASEKSRIMEELPPPGSNRLMDRFMQGYEGAGVSVNPLGVEVLGAVKRVTAADWYVRVALPTSTAFAPIHSMQLRMLAAALLLSLLAGGLTWWLVKRQLAPLLAAAGTLAAVTESSRELTPLPVAGDDEIGVLIRGFNRLLGILKQREESLEKSQRQLEESQRVAQIGGWSWDVVNQTLAWSDETFRRFDRDPTTFTPTVEYFLERVDPRDRAAVQKALQDSLENDAPYHIQPRIINEGGREWVLEGFGIVERDGSGRPLRFAGTAQDITERRRAEEALREGNEMFSLFIRHSPIYAYIKIVTPAESRVLQASDNFLEMIGVPGSQMMGKTMTELFPAELAAKITADDWAVVSRGVRLTLNEQLNGRSYTSIKFPLVLSEKSLLAGYTIDITERKQAEEQIRRSLAEKTVMLREIHHRVKNNMQVIYSLLNLQARSVGDSTVRAMLEESRNRVGSMALIHETLYQSRDLAHVEFKQYLTSLVAGIADTYRRQNVAVQVEMDQLSLDVNVGIPCGLIVNELVSNSLKHGFPGDRAGRVKVGITRDGAGNHVLTVADDGAGFPHNLDFRSTPSLGLQLVNVLTGQIRGAIELDTSVGTAFRITFPAGAQETPGG